MSGWNKLRKKHVIKESIGAIIMLGSFVLGVLFDAQVSKGIIWHYVTDINSFSLTLLQIQAAVATLTIALVALISGSISDSYMGVAISDYYLNIRPGILKQKTIIYLSIGLLTLGVGGHLWEAYNTVVGLFIATVVLVFISIMQIYSLFDGRRVLEKEIEEYISHVMSSKKKYQDKVKSCQKFLSDWKEFIEKQDKATYDKYAEIYTKSIFMLLKYATNQSVQDVENLSCAVAEFFLKSDKQNIKKRGMQYIDDIYEKIWLFIVDNRSVVANLSTRFSLFSNVVIELQDAINDMSPEMLERLLDWKYLSDNIARVAVWMHDITEEKNTGELESINQFSRFVGYYLARQKRKGYVINSDYWGNILRNLYLTSAWNVPEETSEQFLYHKVQMYFNYCYGLIVNGFGNIIKDNLYLREMRNIYKIDNRYQALFYLAIQCYLFYLTEENEECVTSEIKQEALQIIHDGEVKKIFSHIIDVLSYGEDVLDAKMENQMLELLERYELLPRYSNTKTIIIQDIIRFYYVFFVSYIANDNCTEELIDNIVDTKDISRYYLQFIGEKEVDTKKIFCKLFGLMYAHGMTNENIETRVDVLYNKLEHTIKRRYKESAIHRAEEYQNEYETNDQENLLISAIENKVQEHLKHKFSSLITEQDGSGGYVKVHLLRCNYLTETLKTENIGRFFWEIDGAFVEGIAYVLKKRNIAETINRSQEFQDNDDFIGHLQQKEVDILLGSEYVLKGKDYKKANQFKEFAENLERIYTGGRGIGLALKRDNIKICIHDVNVAIHSLTLGEVDVDYDEKRQLYTYEISHGMSADFEKQELESFIHNQRKILDITMRISVICENAEAGVLVVG